MPSMNIYTSPERVSAIDSILDGVKSYVASELSGSSRRLEPWEVSVRVIVPATSRMIGNTEFVINAYAYPERVSRQDEISANVKKYILAHCPRAGEVYGWLQLGELGHSE